MAVIFPRQYGSNVCRDAYGRTYYCNSSWNSWGRWVALVVVLVVFFVFFFLCSCFSARRRRKAGRQPFYGTGWAGRNGHGQAEYNPGYQTQPQASTNAYTSPPAYNPDQGGYNGQHQGYFGGQQRNDVEMQPPQNTYQGGENVYQPPVGPPPGKR